MSILEALKSSVGTWRGTTRLHDPNTGAPEDSLSTLTLTPTTGEAHLRLDYTWSYQSASHRGTLLIEDTFSDQVTVSWTDTWHMGDDTMQCKGAIDADGALSLLGSYPALPGPDWGWRILIQVRDDIQVKMYNLSPEGQEVIAVEATYSRVSLVDADAA